MATDSTVYQSVDEGARRRFEAAWLAGRPEPIDNYLPACDCAHFLPTLEELVHIEMEMRWKKGQGGPDPPLTIVYVEDYLQRFPQLRQTEIILRLVKQEYQIRQRLGEQPSPADYASRFPDVILDSQQAHTLLGAPGPTRVLPEITQVPGYIILDVLGRGGMGVVYLARQLGLNRLVALKMILSGGHADADQLTRFRREAEAVASLQHPNIVQIYEIGEQGGRPYFSLEYVAGGSLDKVLSGKPQPAAATARLVETLARAIHTAHQRSIIHRDLKPANILLQMADGRLPIEKADQSAICHLPSAIPKVTDFGLAKQLEMPGQTKTDMVMGTPSYMAPEQAAGKVRELGPAADVYSLGAILYEMLTGRPPFRAETTWATVQQVINEEPVSPQYLNSQTPSDLETICLKCLEKDQGKRYDSALALAEDLRRFQAGEPILARPIRSWHRLGKWARRQPLVASLLGLVVLTTLLGFAGIAWQWQLAESHRQTAEQRADNEARARKDQEEALRTAQRHLYFHQIGLADRDWWQNELDSARRFLTATPAKLRHWEWHLLDWRCRSPLQQISTSTFTVAFSPRERLLATGTAGEVYLWDEAGSLLATLPWPQPNNAQIFRVVFSPDGTYLAAGGSSNVVPVWHVKTKKLVHRLAGHSGRVHRLAFSPDGEQLACGTGTHQEGSVYLWHVPTGRLQRKLSGHLTMVDFVSYSPDGQKLASAAWDHRVKIWNPATGQELGFIQDHVHDVAFTPDNRFLATTAVDRSIKIWDLESRQVARVLTGHTDKVGTLAFDGHDLLASGGADTAIRIWNWRSGELKQVFRGAPYRVQQLAFSPGGERLASAGTAVKIWNLDADQEAQLLARHTSRFALSRDGQRLATADSGNNTVTLWDPSTGRILRAFPSSGRKLLALAFAPAASHLALGHDDGSVILIDLATGQAAQKITHPQLRLLAFSPDGRRLATAGFSGKETEVRLWDLAEGRERQRWSASISPASGLSFDHDGRLLVCGSGSKPDLYVFREGSAAAVNQWPTGHRPLLASAPGSPTIALAGRGDGAVLLDARTGQQKLGLKGTPRALAFSPDGQRLALADKTITLWDTEAGIESLTLTVPSRFLTDTYFTDLEKRTWGIFVTDVQLAEQTLAARTCEGSVWLWRSQTPPARPVRITAIPFDRFPLGAVNEATFADYGIRFETASAAQIAKGAPAPMPLGRRQVLQGTGPQPTDTRIFYFDQPLSGFGLTCIGLAGGSSLARWRLEALDSQGNILATTGEMEFSKDPLPRTYRLRAEGIAAVRLFCDNRWGDSVWATYTSLPLVEIFLERPE